MIEMPQVDAQKCDGCGICVSACYCGALILRDGKAVIIETASCGWCTVCETVCPTGALTCPFEIIFEE